MCHLILLLPVLALPLLWSLPPAAAIPVYGVVLLLSAGVYRYAVAAMRRPLQIGAERLLRRGGVVEHTAPGLRVRVDGDSWPAESPDALAVGDAVIVAAMQGLRLSVRRAETRHGGAGPAGASDSGRHWQTRWRDRPPPDA